MVRPIRSFRSLGVACGLAIFAMAAPARGDEVWVAPTQQQDLGGLGIGSNVFWPVTPIGAVRLAWGVPDDLQTFQGAKLVLIPHAPAGPGTLNLFVCRAQNSDLVGAACTGPAAHAFTGVANRLIEVDVSAAVGAQVGAAGLNYLAVLAYTTPTTTTDHIVGLRFAYTRTVPNGVATLAANIFSGTQTAPAFAGDGSALTNLPTPPGVATLGANSFSGTQTAPAFVGNGSGLTNLPFPAGAATLGANTFTATQTINTGNLDLDTSTATTGNLTKNGALFLHNFGVANTFVGVDAGNVTMTGGGNTATGIGVLFRNTTGAVNTGNGAFALTFNTTGNSNTATGGSALTSNTTGENNTATGASALVINTTGGNNTATGVGALAANTTGLNNVAVGAAAGSSSTIGSNNIYLGALVEGVAGESNAMYLGRQGTQTKTIIAGIRGTAVVGGEPVVIDATGRLGSGAVSPGANTVGTTEVINDSLTANDLAANSVGTSEVAFNYAASASEGGAASDVACVGCVSASEVNFGFATLGANTFTATQTINTGNLDLDVSTATTGNITKDGAPFLHNFGPQNTFLGVDAGNVTMTGNSNTASGVQTLRFNTTGTNNTASGFRALELNTAGIDNTASGILALTSNTTGDANMASGAYALASNNIGIGNTASGYSALFRNTTGTNNAASGANALFNNTTGNNNVAVGTAAGSTATIGSNNIYLGAHVPGVAGESNAIYLGLQGTQTKTVIAGIRGIAVVGGEPVVIDANGRLGSGAVSPGVNTVGTAEVINDSLTANDLAANSVGMSEVAFNYAASASEGGPASDLACAGCVSASEVGFTFATPGANTFTGTQIINGGNLDLDHSTLTAGSITINGTRFLHDFGIGNTFVGGSAGNFTMTGGSNTASGSSALLFNTSGGANTASGVSALRFNTTGNNNTAAGAEALNDNTSGANNTASGNEALQSNTTGNNNVALGFGAGGNATTGSNNIYLGANVAGVAGEANTTYIGGPGIQTRTFIAGVRGTTVPGPAIPVLIDIFGQLGTAFSSRRYKEDIQTMADASRRLLQLRPVTFRYKQAYRDGSKPIQFGLIAEEVAEVFPELVVSNAEGETETVHYETLNVLLLNELQKQQQRIEALERKLNELLVSRR